MECHEKPVNRFLLLNPHPMLIVVMVLANTLLEQQRKGLKDTHKDGCPWKVQQCEGMCDHTCRLT